MPGGRLPTRANDIYNKLKLAAEIVSHQKEQGIVFDFVTAEGY